MRGSRWFATLPSTPELNVLIFSFLLNLAWEMWQVPFFLGMADAPHWQGVKACTQATAGDAGIALTAFWVAAARARTRHWIHSPGKADLAVFIGTGLIVTIAFEALATSVLGRWAYTESMPRLPFIGTGLLPLLQWLLIPPLVIWFSGRQMRGNVLSVASPGWPEEAEAKGGRTTFPDN